jgi:hypothetical protein
MLEGKESDVASESYARSVREIVQYGPSSLSYQWDKKGSCGPGGTVPQENGGTLNPRMIVLVRR